MSKKDYMNIHFMRIFACILVVIIHTTATPSSALTLNSLPQLIFLVVNQFAKAAVPIFVFISGFLLNKIYKDQKIDVLPFWTKRLPKIVAPYVLWSFLYYAIYAYKGFYPLDLGFIIKGLLYGTFIYHLYFMIIIIQFYLLFPLFHRIATRLGEMKFFLIAILIQLALLETIFPYRDRFFTSYIIYFALGMLISAKSETGLMRIKQPLWFLLLWIFAGGASFTLALNLQNQWVPFTAFIYAFFYVIISAVSIMALYWFFERFSNGTKRVHNFVKQLSNATQFIYFAHPLILMVMVVLMDRLSIVSMSLRALIQFLAVIVFLFPFAMYFKSIGYKILGRPSSK